MQIIEKKVIDQVQVISQSGVILVRFVTQKWVVSGDQEILVEPRSGLHRTSVLPGDWSLADELGVRSYADVAWTPEILQAAAITAANPPQKFAT